MENLQEYEIPLQIGRGSQGEVFRISDLNAAKIDLYGHLDPSRRMLEKELKISKELYLSGISVPKPKGIFPIRFPLEVKDGFVMEFIEGKTRFALDRNEFKHVENLLKIELKKVKDLGFRPYDIYIMGNSIWSPEKDKLYLIDFASWSKK